MKKTEAITHIFTNPGTKARRERWGPARYIIAHPDGSIYDENGNFADLNTFHSEGWEIVKELIKYETHIWLPHEPSLNLDYNENRQFLERLTDSSYYLDNESNGYNRKFKITVEEV